MNTAKTCHDISITIRHSDLAIVSQIVDFDRGYDLTVLANDLGLEHTTRDNDPCVVETFDPEHRFHAALPGAAIATTEDCVFFAGVPLAKLKTFLERSAA